MLLFAPSYMLMHPDLNHYRQLLWVLSFFKNSYLKVKLLENVIKKDTLSSDQVGHWKMTALVSQNMNIFAYKIVINININVKIGKNHKI